MVTTMTISDYGQVYKPFDSTGPVFPLNSCYHILLYFRFYYIVDKLAYFSTNAQKTELYFCHLADSILNIKWPNDNKYNSGLCAFVLKFANLS